VQDQREGDKREAKATLLLQSADIQKNTGQEDKINFSSTLLKTVFRACKGTFKSLALNGA
jgi:hypothetical protein